MKISQIMKAVEISVKTKRPVMIWGSPGVGKSDAVKQVAEKMGLELIDVRALLFDPVDLRGVPYVGKQGQTEWATPAFLPTKGKGILFIDELPNAPPTVQAAFYQLILDRKLADYVMPDGWAVVAAGNRQTDRAATHAMPSPLANRFVHVEAEPNLDEFTTWALRSGINLQIISFLRFKTDMLSNFVPTERAFPSPRSWAILSDVLKHTEGQDFEFDLIKGTVGEGAAVEFLGFTRIWNELPNIRDILDSPLDTKVPTAVAAKYAVVTSLGVQVDTPEKFTAAIAYANRMPPEFQVIMIRDVLRRDIKLSQSEAYVQWAVKNAEKLL